MDQDILQCRRDALRTLEVFQEAAEQDDELECFRVSLFDIPDREIAQIAGEDYSIALQGLVNEANYFDHAFTFIKVSTAPLCRLICNNVKNHVMYTELLDKSGETSGMF